MKIGVSSYSFRKHILATKCDYVEICDKAKEMGFDGIEFINLDNKDWGITDDAMKTAKEIKEHCAKIGLDVIAYTIGANFLAEDKEAEVKRLFHEIDVAEALGAPVLRHDVCYALPAEHLYSWREAVKDMAPNIRRVTEYAKSKGIKTCTENHGFIFQAPERVEALIREVNSDNYGWLIDMGNFLCVDRDPVTAVETAARYAFHVHAKDFIFKSGEVGNPGGFMQTAGGNFIRGTIIGHGVVPVKNAINILKKVGYEGYVSVEFEGLEECLAAIKAGGDYLRKLI